jgi:hypothetical protein
MPKPKATSVQQIGRRSLGSPRTFRRSGRIDGVRHRAQSDSQPVIDCLSVVVSYGTSVPNSRLNGSRT